MKGSSEFFLSEGIRKLSAIFRLTDVFSGYFGKLNCVDWSPDGRYIIVSVENGMFCIL